MRKVFCISGISGAGKSHLARKMAAKHLDGDKNNIVSIVSADHYFTTEAGYCFDSSKLGQAHSVCFRRFIETLKIGIATMVIVDNTNLTALELSPYVLGAGSFGYDSEVITIYSSIATSHASNVHGVGLDEVKNQYYKLIGRTLPDYWNQSYIDSEQLNRATLVSEPPKDTVEEATPPSITMVSVARPLMKELNE